MAPYKTVTIAINVGSIYIPIALRWNLVAMLVTNRPGTWAIPVSSDRRNCKGRCQEDQRREVKLKTHIDAEELVLFQ